MRRLAVGLVTLLVLVGCTDDPTVSAATSEVATQVPTEAPVAPTEPAPEGDSPDTAAELGTSESLFPAVVGVTASISNGESWNFAVTLLSEYDSPDRYADAWRVLDTDGNELGIRVLGHDHAGEQPFTRSHTIDVPADLTTVFIEGRDQLNGWSGERFELTLNR